MGRIKLYFLAARPQFLPAIALPVGLGAAAAWRYTGRFNLTFFILSLLAAMLYHAGMNVLNDYFDYKNGTDNINENALTPFTGGSRFIQKGLLTPGATLMYGACLIAFGSAIGIYLSYAASPLLLVIGAVGLFSGYFYSAPPIFLAGRGLGELTVGLNFGLLTVLGSYIVHAEAISSEPVLASLPLSFLITAILYINEFPDYEADKRTGKRNLVVILGPAKARYGILFITLAAYLSIIPGIVLGMLPSLSIIALFGGLIIIPGIKGLFRSYAGSPALIPSIKSVILAHLATGLLQIISFLL